MSTIPRWYWYAAIVILVVGVVIGLLVSGAAGALWGGLLSLLGVSGAEHIRRDQAATQAAILAHQRAEAEKEKIWREAEAAEAARKRAKKERERARAIEETRARERRRQEAESADPGILRERLLREARDAQKE